MFPEFLAAHLLIARRRAARAVSAAPARTAMAKLAAAPAHAILMRVPATHGAQTQSTGAGVSRPTPAELASAAVQQLEQLAQGIVAQKNAWAASHRKPTPNAQPADVAAWLTGAGISPRVAFPEWGWRVVQKGPPLAIGGPLGSAVHALIASVYEPGEALAAVQLGDHDAAFWYVHPSGAWSYHHVWGEPWDQVLGDVATAVGHAVSEGAKVVGEAIHYAQIAASVIPGVGQVVNEVVAAAETALDALSGANALQLALESAYRAALAAVPGAEALTPMLDPVVDALRSMAGGQSITHAALAQVIARVPDSPSVGPLSPRSVAGSLASWLASKVGLA